MSGPIKIAVFDSKSYDKKSFEEHVSQKGQAGSIELTYIDDTLSEQSVHLAQGHKSICIFVNDDANAKVIAKLAEYGVQLILLRCAGFDRVDLAAATKHNISVTRVPAYSPHAVAEFATALLLTLNRKTHKSFNRVRNNDFTLQGLVGFDIHNRTVGVIGTGQIGQCFIQIMLGFGCKVLAYDLYPNDRVRQMPNVKYTTLDDLFRNSDIISLHAPATPETVNIINAKSIAIMKTGVIIINTARGTLIDSKALVDGLMNKKIGGAGLDVYHNERSYFFRDISDEEIEDEILVRLQNMRNVVITSHQAYLTREALNAIAETTFKSVHEFFVEKKRSKQLTYFVDPSQVFAGSK